MEQTVSPVPESGYISIQFRRRVEQLQKQEEALAQYQAMQAEQIRDFEALFGLSFPAAVEMIRQVDGQAPPVLPSAGTMQPVVCRRCQAPPLREVTAAAVLRLSHRQGRFSGEDICWEMERMDEQSEEIAALTPSEADKLLRGLSLSGLTLCGSKKLRDGVVVGLYSFARPGGVDQRLGHNGKFVQLAPLIEEELRFGPLAAHELRERLQKRSVDPELLAALHSTLRYYKSRGRFRRDRDTAVYSLPPS